MSDIHHGVGGRYVRQPNGELKLVERTNWTPEEDRPAEPVLEDFPSDQVEGDEDVF